MARNRVKIGSLSKQIKDTLDEKLKIGESKQQDKILGISNKYIYSWDTYKSYMKHLNYFADYCKGKYNCKTLDECFYHIGEWLNTRSNLSPYTIKLEVAAICKCYNLTSEDLHLAFDYVAPKRTRQNITRSRNECIRDKHFSEENNKDFVTFCKCTGLRRSEIKSLKSDKLIFKNNQYYILVDSGSKGGRTRLAPLMCDTPEELEIVLRQFKKYNGNEVYKVWPKVPNGADIHSYRSVYATRCYLSQARSIEELEKCPKVKSKGGRMVSEDLYIMRNDRAGTIFDKKAMLFASQCLGHNRIDVIGSHYLRNL